MKILCRIREIQKAALKVESEIESRFGISFNEGMLLCVLRDEGSLSSGTISDRLSLTLSNTSKVLRSAEEKGLIERVMGLKDKRQMYFSVTERGLGLLDEVDRCDFDIPQVLEGICGCREV